MAEPVDLGGATVASLPSLNFTYRPVDESAPDDQIAKVRAGEGIALSVPTGAGD